MTVTSSLPIEAVRDAIVTALDAGPRAVLVAPPGAGKTTRVPLMLLDRPWAAGGRIVLLEPRRLAARAAAERMAATLDEAVGETVGLRARFDTRVSARTRIEVVTEGVFTRLIADDPELAGVAAVIFDEFHERSLDADLGLALALDVQGALRDDLRIVVMSATLDGARVAAILDGAPVIESQGRAFPVETRYVGRNPERDLASDVAAVVVRALGEEPGSVIAFLPGQREILRAADALAGRIGANTDVTPLFGAMDRAAQDRAVRPSLPGRRKVVLATSIAETSLTIEGVRVVVDGGQTRIPRFEPDLGLTRLETVRVSRAAADQRRGRAGRTEPGVCYRLWEEAGNGALQAYARPEILDADLSGLLLDLASWGVRDPATLRWLDPPPAPAVTAGRALLESLEALDRDGTVTAEGRAMAGLALPPRLARMVLEAARRGAAEAGAELAV
ncbi:MAG: ATP-dependent helicase HrpB, partial [Caulobacteraceae bacterium]|nr:ATP-dependent helicase HrpB [Caulobacter sp.]